MPEPSGYPADVRANFIENCTLTSGGSRSACECMFEAVEAQVPVDEFLAAEQGMLASGGALPANVARAVNEAMAECA